MSDDHAAEIERAFSQQAAAFEDPRLNRFFTADAGWVLEHLELAPDRIVLDVAAGTGHAARSLAPAVRAVIALDATLAMLEAGKVAAEEAGLRNVVFQRGDAAALPFLDASFDVVVSRFALHHLEAPSAAVAEMARCLRPGGQLVVADLVCSDDPATADAQNRLERLRDPSHARTLSASELRALVAGVGELSNLDARDIARPLRPWLAQTDTRDEVAARIAAALRAELDGGPATGLRPREEDGELRFVHTVACATAAKPCVGQLA
jgi:ubiquinone/menaquinone biosynthesis C-methylase UbiE